MYSEFLTLVNSGNVPSVGIDQEASKIYFNLKAHSSQQPQNQALQEHLSQSTQDDAEDTLEASSVPPQAHAQIEEESDAFAGDHLASSSAEASTSGEKPLYDFLLIQ